MDKFNNGNFHELGKDSLPESITRMGKTIKEWQDVTIAINFCGIQNVIVVENSCIIFKLVVVNVIVYYIITYDDSKFCTYRIKIRRVLG